MIMRIYISPFGHNSKVVGDLFRGQRARRIHIKHLAKIHPPVPPISTARRRPFDIFDILLAGGSRPAPSSQLPARVDPYWARRDWGGSHIYLARGSEAR
jgi:hypothetical protein